MSDQLKSLGATPVPYRLGFISGVGLAESTLEAVLVVATEHGARESNLEPVRDVLALVKKLRTEWGDELGVTPEERDGAEDLVRSLLASCASALRTEMSAEAPAQR